MVDGGLFLGATMTQKSNTSLNQIVVVLGCLLLDILFVITADLVSFAVRFNGLFPKINFDAYLKIAFFIIVFRLIAFYVFHLYDKPKYKSNFEIFINTIKACTASSVVIVFIMYFLDIEAYPRSIVAISWILTIFSTSGWRFVLKEFIESYLGKDFFYSHVIIIGVDNQAGEIGAHMQRDATINYKLLGFIAPKNNAPTKMEKSKILGTIDSLPMIIKKYPIDEIVMAEKSLGEYETTKLANFLSKEKILLRSSTALYDKVITSMALHKQELPFAGSTVLSKPASWYHGIKQLLDMVFSVLILFLTSPLLLLAVLLIKFTSPGPIFYFQKRTGCNGKPFTMYKLRTMYINAEKSSMPHWTKKNDIRITPVGKVLRRYRIDELPQLANVLRNEMSLIGPRPERPYFTSRLAKKVPFYAERLSRKPGISGWAQVTFKYAATEKDTEQKLLYDLFYIQNMSFALDFLIALKTLKVVITGRGAQ